MKFVKTLKSVLTGFIISGMIIILVGMYYLVIKAGIPYQDPPLELQIKYAVNMGTGEELLRIGGLLFVTGIAGRIVMFLTDRKICGGQIFSA